MKRGPYKQYFNPESENKSLPKALKKRRGITEADLNLSREEEVARWLTIHRPINNDQERLDGEDIQSNHELDVSDNEGVPADLSEDSTESISDEESSSSSSSSSSEVSSTRSSRRSSTHSEEIPGDVNLGEEGSDGENTNTGPGQNVRFKTLSDFLANNAKDMQLNITLNPANVIIMILTLALAHDFTLTAVVDILKVINVICCCNLFPSTRYLFKKHFNPAVGTTFHVVCQRCKHYLGEKGTEGIETCTNCNTVNTVEGYKYEYSFITLDIKSQLEDILLNPTCKFNFREPGDNSVLRDISCGSMYRNAVPGNLDDNVQYITFTFNLDATPISKDNRTSITPIYLSINELDLVSRRKNLILAALWYGKVKPRNDIFLKPFTDTFNVLSNEGIKITINGVTKTFKLLPICACVDTIARAPMQGLVGVNGYYCCSWCEIKGALESNTVKYTFQHPTPTERTEERFRDCYIKFADGKDTFETKGVNSVTPLINLQSFNMVWGFTPDYLHCVLLGVTKRIIDLWFGEKGEKVFYIGSPSRIRSIDSVMSKLKFPTILKRAPILMNQRKAMKGRELENWLLYYSVPVLKGILPERYLIHWKLLVCGISQLLQDKITEDEVNSAELKLVEFVYFVDELYTEYEMTYNVHQLLHLAESCRRWGPLWTHTTFPFESSFRKCKRILKASRGVPHQIVRSLEMSRALDFILQKHGCSDEVSNVCEAIKKFKLQKTYISVSKETLVHSLGEYSAPVQGMEGLPQIASFTEYAKVIKNNVTYKKYSNTDKKTDDSYVRLIDGSFAKILHVLCLNETAECYLVVQKYICCEEEGLIFTKKITQPANVCAVKFEQVNSSAIRITINEGQDYISHIPRNHYVLNM